MTTVVRCSKCKRRYSLREELVGRRLKCKACGTPLPVLEPDEDDAFLADIDEAVDQEAVGQRLPPKASRRSRPRRRTSGAVPWIRWLSPGYLVLVAVIWIGMLFGGNAGVLIPLLTVGVTAIIARYKLEPAEYGLMAPLALAIAYLVACVFGMIAGMDLTQLLPIGLLIAAIAWMLHDPGWLSCGFLGLLNLLAIVLLMAYRSTAALEGALRAWQNELLLNLFCLLAACVGTAQLMLQPRTNPD